MKNKGFSLIEIIVSIAVLAIVFSFMFYFVSSINHKRTIKNSEPYFVKSFDYSGKYCSIEDGQLSRLSIVQDIDMGSYVSTSTVITGLNIFDKNKIVMTTDSASTTEPDLFLFEFSALENTMTLSLKEKLDIGPGTSDMVLHGNVLYLLNASVNSHVKSYRINRDSNSFLFLNEIKIQDLSQSHALPKKIYMIDRAALVGSEKNSTGGELFVLPISSSTNILQYPTRSLEIGGQVSGVFANQDLIFLANASDTELFVYDRNFDLKYLYDAPLSLGNGKSVYYSEPYIFLGRTVASYELFFLEIKDAVLNYISKHKANGSIDFIQNVGQYILVMTNYSSTELQFFSKNRELVKGLDLPSKVNAYACYENTFLLSVLINNQSHILWVK